jgi:hypothetical protein
MKKLIAVIGFLAVLFISCPDEDIDPIDAPGVIKKTFFVHNFKTNKAESVETGSLADGKYCHVWVGRGVNIAKAKDTAKSIANTYDNNIYSKMLQYFSFSKDDGLEYDGIKLNNTLDMVKCLVKGDGKLNIVLVDIPDNFQQGVNNAYTAGYFLNSDFYERKTNPSSNECAVIFVDTYPGKPGSEDSNSTLAHEMQHLMNFLNCWALEKDDFDTWIDEGLSLSAEYLFLGKQLTVRINHYNNDPSGLIKKGNNFFVWGNRNTEHNYYSLDDYATDYLFFQWLRLQTSNDIYSSIMFSSENNYQAVLDAYNDKASASNKVNGWDSLLKTWLAANQINASSGLLGYKGQINITAPTAPGGTTSLSLYPGEGVYSKTPSAALSPSGNIKYAYLTANNVSDSYSANTTTLLTYNKNTNIKGNTESGTTTGAASVQIVPDARFIASLSNEPIRIDARDMMGRDEWRENYLIIANRFKRGGNDE